MRRLLDGNVSRAFAALLPGHRVTTIHQRRWSDLDDRPLLDAAEAEFDAFLTMDQNLRFQQNIRGRSLRIIVLRATRKTLPVLVPLAPLILRSLPEKAPGELKVIGA